MSEGTQIFLTVWAIFGPFVSMVLTSCIWDTIRNKDVKSIQDQAVAAGYAGWNHGTENGEYKKAEFEWLTTK